MHTSFAVLPPHFVKWNDELQEIMDVQYPKQSNPITGKKILARMFMASLVFRREEIKRDLGQKFPHHPLFQTEIFKLPPNAYERVKSCLYTSSKGDTMPVLIGGRPEGQMVPCGLPVQTRTMALLEADRDASTFVVASNSRRTFHCPCRDNFSPRGTRTRRHIGKT